MDENAFFSTALGEWIQDCFCSTSSTDETNHNSIAPLINYYQCDVKFQKISYELLCDGVTLNRLFYFINPTSYGDNTSYVNVLLANLQLDSSTSKDLAEERTTLITANYECEKQICLLNRLRWFHLLKRLLQNFYWTNSQCLLSFPNTVVIANHPKAEISGHEMLRLVGLLLGAAVQSDRREIFIERLKSMRPQLQQALIAEIQRVTKDGDCMISLETLQELLRQYCANENSNNDGNDERRNCEAKSTNESNNKSHKDEEVKKQHMLTSLIECLMKDRDDYATALLDIVTAHTADRTTSQSGEYSPTSSYTTSNTNSEATSGVATMDEIPDYLRGVRRGSPLPLAADTAVALNNNDKPPAPASLTSMKVISTSTTSSIASSAGGVAQGVSDLHGPGMFSGGMATTCDIRSVSAVEYAALKAEVRKLRNQNEQFEELQMYLQEDVEHRDAQISKLQAERLELIKDARAAKDYRDEIDCMQHKIIRLERLETENEKLKSKLSEINFYKTRVNSLKEDNDLMQNTYHELEEQLEQCQRKMASYLELEKRMIESQAHVKSLQLDLTKTREQVEDLLVENGRLERESKEYAQKCLELQRRIDMTASTNSPRELVGVFSQTLPSPNASLNDSSLLAQLDACNQTQLLELQLENRKLKLQLESATNAANPGELFEIRAELIESKKIIEMRANEKSELIAKLNAEKEALAEASAAQTTLRQRLNEAELALSETKRNASTTNQEQMDELKTKLANLEQEAATKAQEIKLLSEEKGQLETQLDKMRSYQKSARADIDRLQEVLSNAEHNRDILERTKRSLENERIALKSRVDAASERVNELERHLNDTEDTRQAINQLEQQLRDKIDELAAAENANRVTKKQIEYNAQKEAKLREELDGERARIAELVERLRAVCISINVNNVSNQPDNELRDVLNNDAHLVATIDEVLMRALNTTRRESDALRIQQKMQIRELDDLKRDIEALRKAENELPAATDKYTEMITENKNIKDQVTILQERLRRLQIDEATHCAELQAARREIDELQQKIFAQNRQSAELCNLRAALRNAQAQEDILRRNVTELQARLDVLSTERNDAQHASRTLATVNQALATDHDRLQQLHHALTNDYECAKLEAGALKQRIKSEKTALESNLHAEFESERIALETKLVEEAAERQRIFQKLVDCEQELSTVSKELLELKRERSPSFSHNASPSTHAPHSAAESHELRRLHLLECAQKSTINNLNMTIQQLNNLLTEKDLEISNLRRQIDMLRQYNGEESRSLIRQIELLLIQNQQLHTRSDVFYAEQKELREKLAQLRRHKEKLEEKIMDQYKAMDSRKIEAKPTFVRRAAKALISKSPGRKLSTTRTTTTKRDGASSSNTEDSSVYSADEGLFTSSANGSGASPIPAPPTVPLPVQSNGAQIQVPLQWNSDRSGIVNKFGVKTNGGGHFVLTSDYASAVTPALTAHQDQLSSNLQRFTKNSEKCESSGGPFYQTLLARDGTRRAQSLTPRLRQTMVGDVGDYSTLESLRRDPATEESKALESVSSSARSSPCSESSGAYTTHTANTNMCDVATKSGTSMLLQRFFSRSSPFRRSTATCSSYSAAPSSATFNSTTSGCSVMSSAEASMCSSATFYSSRHGTHHVITGDSVIVIPPAKKSCTNVAPFVRKTRASSLCFRISRASRNAIFRQRSEAKIVQDQQSLKSANIPCGRCLNAHKIDAERQGDEILYPSRRSDNVSYSLVPLTLSDGACYYNSFCLRHRQRLGITKVANGVKIASADATDKTDPKRLSAYDNIKSCDEPDFFSLI